MRSAAAWVVGLSILMVGCGGPAAFSPPAITSVQPSNSGTPNSVVSFGTFEFVSVQGTGQIFTYNIGSGFQAPVGAPYATPCADPSGMVVTTIAGANVMAVPCYDTNSLLTLTVNANGSLNALGSVGGLAMPFPGIALDGTNLFVPLFGGTSANGGIAKVSLASPANPTIEGMVTLASPVAGGIANAEYLAVANGYVYVTAGSESNPQGSSSTVQVISEGTMTLVGSPLTVPHSPQQIAVQGNVAYVTLYDATELESIDISNPAALVSLQNVSLTAGSQSCHPEPVTVEGGIAYVGCFAEGAIARLDIANPSQMQPMAAIAGLSSPQRLALAGSSLLVTGGSPGGQIYAIDLNQF